MLVPATIPEEVGEVPAGISGVAEEAGTWDVESCRIPIRS